MAVSMLFERAGEKPLGVRAERRFFSAYLIALLVPIFIGFAPSFYLRGLVEPYWPLKPLQAAMIVHGTVMSLWVLLFPIQALLIGSGRRSLHIRLGTWGFVLGCGTAGLAYLAAMALYHEPRPPGALPVAPIVPLADIALLVVLLACGWHWRRNAQVHKRIMVTIVCLLALSAVGRMPLWQHYSLMGLGSQHLVAGALILPLWLWDLATLRRPHLATFAGSVLLAAALVPRIFPPAEPDKVRLVSPLPGFGVP